MIQVAASGLPRYIGLAIVVAAISVVIGMLCIVHRVARARRKINFEVIKVLRQCLLNLPLSISQLALHLGDVC